MHNACMGTKTISLRIDAYERLRAARRDPGESFTQVVLRATWPEVSTTGRDLLRYLEEHGPTFSESGLERIERLKREAQPPVDKWQS